jgi:hypothetical protein
MTPSVDVVSLSSTLGADSVGAGADYCHSNGTPQHNGTDGSKTALASVQSLKNTAHKQIWIPLVDRVLWEPEKKVKVISIGCGFSGLTLAQKIQHKYKLDHIIEHVIYEKNSEVGGTWFEVSSILRSPKYCATKTNLEGQEPISRGDVRRSCTHLHSS